MSRNDRNPTDAPTTENRIAAQSPDTCAISLDAKRTLRGDYDRIRLNGGVA